MSRTPARSTVVLVALACGTPTASPIALDAPSSDRGWNDGISSGGLGVPLTPELRVPADAWAWAGPATMRVLDAEGRIEDVDATDPIRRRLRGTLGARATSAAFDADGTALVALVGDRWVRVTFDGAEATVAALRPPPSTWTALSHRDGRRGLDPACRDARLSPDHTRSRAASRAR